MIYCIVQSIIWINHLPIAYTEDDRIIFLVHRAWVNKNNVGVGSTLILHDRAFVLDATPGPTFQLISPDDIYGRYFEFRQRMKGVVNMRTIHQLFTHDVRSMSDICRADLYRIKGVGRVTRGRLRNVAGCQTPNVL